MLRSFPPRNIFIISGVVTIHLLAWLLFAPSSFESERSLTSESMMVNLVNQRTQQPSQRKDALMPKTTAITPAENLDPRPSEGPSVSNGEAGGSSSLGLIPRQVLHNPKPNYPFLSRKLREQGLVMIKLCVNPAGFVDEASVFKSSGFQSLDRSALATLSQWRFRPLISTISHSSQCFQAPVHFSLEG
ncbi:energy transducer TonB [Polynucleobacter sp. AP-Capit-er-40B-B4]|nr:energy transducer TonB [Polynucleobacter sp. AP-Capit-er-40B-B4]